jgi:7,8-didemethyl-8-hydroxy-5-deazariboflavin synthase CofG subunit
MQIEEQRFCVLRVGELSVPFTSGLLVGIGESAEDRLRDLLTLRQIHEEYGHLQELIIQPFRAKPGTRMAEWAEPSTDEWLRTVSIARLLFGASFNIQAPPNLSIAAGSSTEQQQDSWKALLDAGMLSASIPQVSCISMSCWHRASHSRKTERSGNAQSQ